MIEDESELRDQIYSRFGTPEEIAAMWRDGAFCYTKQYEMAVHCGKYSFFWRRFRTHSRA